MASNPRPKYGYVTGFDSANEYIRWNLNVESGATYNATLLMNPGAANQSFELAVSGAATNFFTVASAGWTREAIGSIFIPSGTHTITLRRDTLSGTAEVKALELMRTDLQSGYENRIAAFKSASAASKASFRSKPWGIMFQYGPWGYALDGSQKSVNAQAADFNVVEFC